MQGVCSRESVLQFTAERWMKCAKWFKNKETGTDALRLGVARAKPCSNFYFIHLCMSFYSLIFYFYIIVLKKCMWRTQKCVYLNDSSSQWVPGQASLAFFDSNRWLIEPRSCCLRGPVLNFSVRLPGPNPETWPRTARKPPMDTF